MAPQHLADVEGGHNGKPASAPKQNAAAATKPAPFKRDLQSAMHNAPQVRVIHIFAPKVIKTDVANFRSTVQKLTGRSKRRSLRAQQLAAPMAPATAPAVVPPASTAYNSVGLWEKEELQRLVGDACGVADPVRCNSVDSGNYSLDSGNTVFSGDSSGVDTSPSSDGFSFYPQRESPYSLNEIPAPFFGLQSHDMPPMSMFQPAASMSGMQLPGHGSLLGALPTSHVMDPQMNMLGFDATDPALSDAMGCNSITNTSSSSGSLFDLPRQHCRLSVQQPYQGANFFEYR